MLERLLHKAVAVPGAYDFVQVVAGSRQVQARVAARVPVALAPGATVVDVGGGTGVFRHVWPPSARFVCADLDPQKLAGFRAKFPGDSAVLADAALLPFADASVDAVACTLVSHHLPDGALHQAMSAIARLLRPGGTLLFADAVWRPARLPSRLLWRYDRGSFPRPAERLREAIASQLSIQHWETFAVWHRYVVCVATRA